MLGVDISRNVWYFARTRVLSFTVLTITYYFKYFYSSYY